jgi:neuronal calcium sensor 1
VTANGSIDKKLHLAFQMYDKNGNGKIDKKEMLKIVTAIYDLTGSIDRTFHFIFKFL